jgi:hypothetical protein
MMNRSLKQEIMHRYKWVAHKMMARGQKRESAMAETVIEGLAEAKTVIFSADQVEIFLRLSADYTETLEYILPFPIVFLQFDRPVFTALPDRGIVALWAMALSQPDDKPSSDTAFINNACFAWFTEASNTVDHKGKMTAFAFAWEANEQQSIHCEHGLIDGAISLKSLAIACIGYINCENIYLHKEGEVPDKVNRKREREGKKILEPYYVCRIRGVQYDSNGQPTGEGTHHGFRYDVRGHFRKLATGKTTWVRPHQRGLQNELYIPKTYVVERGAKPAA